MACEHTRDVRQLRDIYAKVAHRVELNKQRMGRAMFSNSYLASFTRLLQQLPDDPDQGEQQDLQDEL